MKTNTAWTFAGNSVYAGCQWAVFVVLVKRLGPDAAGAFAFALAVTGPVFVLASLRLRHLLAAQSEPPRDFSGYVAARLLTTAAAVGISIVAGMLVSPAASSIAVLTIMALGRSCDALSDLCHGLFQRELDMRSAAIGISINGLLSVLLVSGAALVSPSIVPATAAYAAASLAALVAWDAPRAARLRRAGRGPAQAGTEPAPPPLAAAWRLTRTALPLGVSSAIGSAQTNLPRYVIASQLGAAALARFAAISYITLAGHLVVNAVSQAALPLLARDAHDPLGSYRARLGSLVAATFSLGALCLLAAFAFGRSALTFIYGPAYAQDDAVLLWLVAAMVVTFASVFLGTGRMARQRFASQSVTSAISLAVVGACIVPLVKSHGLLGAAWSLVAGALVELFGYVIFTARDLGAAARASDAGWRTATARPQPAATVRVLNVLGRLERGGAELRTVELAEAFPSDRVRSDFLVLTGLGGALDDRVRTAGGDVIKCRLDLRFPLRFLRVLRQGRYDVVHSHVHYFSGVILTLARIAGVPRRISHLHTARVNDRAETRRRRLQLGVCRRLIDWNATGIVAAGEGAMIASWGPAWRSDGRCRVVYNAVRAERLRVGVGGRAQRPTIVNVASVKPLKNQLRLVGILACVAARVPAVQLLFVGRQEDADYAGKVRQAAADAGLADRLSFVGEVDEAVPLLATAHLLILPSFWEGLPCAALEACAVGTPVLASDLPGTREIARHFPYVHLLSLDESDEAWAAAAARIFDSGPIDGAEAAEWFARSPFVFDRSRSAHFEIWSGLRASA